MLNRYAVCELIALAGAYRDAARTALNALFNDGTTDTRPSACIVTLLIIEMTASLRNPT